MNTRIIISGIMLIMLAGCYDIHDYPIEPVARFTASSYSVGIGQDVYFNNGSLYADYFEWDFGDGYYSNTYNPVHYYSHPGTYTVSLTAFQDGGYCHTLYTTIYVYANTTLEITVLEYYDEYPVADASIILYPTLQDWYNETHPVLEVYTDARGKAVIDDLPPVSYYIDVWHPNHNNYVLAEEDVSYIRIPPLVRNGYNYFVAWVDYVPGGYKKKGEVLQSLKKGRTYMDKEQKK